FVAAGIGALALSKLVKNRAGAPPTSEAFQRLLVTCALAGAAFPVLINKTRSDLCHIGFVAPGCALLLLALIGQPLGAAQPGRRVLMTLQATAALGVAASLLVAAWFGWSNARAPYVRRALADIDRLARSDFRVDSDDELLLPTDLTVHLPPGYFPGGFSYLLSRRQSAISFSILEDDGQYFAEQWPVAAREVKSRRPRLMKITRADLQKLASYQPEISSMYFGYDGRYMLDERRPGPEIPEKSSWTYQIAGGESGTASLATSHGKLTVTLHTPRGDAGPVLGSIDADRVAILHEWQVYVGKLSPNGQTIDGHVYTIGTSNEPLPTFRMRRTPG
ncbi:MAG TPA: hypothetical protein VNG33_02505, partial [Polyangiaceae bacterium]|nr:hypothetical protein [Polyangiaceae bacterium]